LAPIVAEGGQIRFAQRFLKWPGRANVEVNLVTLTKSQTSGGILDSQHVDFISSRLDFEAEQPLATLSENANRAFIGNLVHGIGFVLELGEAEALRQRNPRNAECLFPYLNGADLNSASDQHPTREVIYFRSWPLERAQQFEDLMDIIEERVRPERAKCKSKRPREYWWQFEHVAHGLEQATRDLTRVLGRSRVSESHAVVFIPKGWICSEQVVLFAFDDYYHFALLQSNVHEAWVRRNASTMRTDIRYTPTDCFETFAFPQTPAESARAEAERLGDAYHEHRRHVMHSRQLGLTKTYNLFHNPQCAETDIIRMRELHAAMDCALLACYGWTDIDPGHGFHQSERSQTRYTITPLIRREILRRLLKLNLEVYNEGAK
jgi:hypothetical protein